MASPTWTEGSITGIGSAGISSSVSRNTTLVGTFNATAKFKVYFLLNIDRTGTTALGTAVSVLVRPKSAVANAGLKVHGNQFVFVSQTLAAVTTTISGANVAIGDSTYNVVSTASWAVGDLGVIAAGTAREEWFRVARITDATHLLLDSPSQYAHTTAQADVLFNKSDAFVTPELPGGVTYEVIFDYGAAATGEAIRAWGSAVTLDTIG